MPKLPDNYNPIFTFFIKFNLLALPLYIVSIINFDFYFIQSATANVVYYFLNILNFSPVIDGIMITIPVQNGAWAALINSACTGWKSALLFLALVFATPKNNKRFALLFIPLIFAINIVRILFMFWVASFDLAYFELAHAIVWSWGMLLAVLALWIIWIKFNNIVNFD